MRRIDCHSFVVEIEKKRRRALGRAKIGGPWELTSMNGEKMSSEDFHGKWLLIYFGFTHCPDICPDELEKMCSIANTLGESYSSAFRQ